MADVKDVADNILVNHADCGKGGKRMLVSSFGRLNKEADVYFIVSVRTREKSNKIK